MSMDLEPAGALATAGLVAKEIEGDAGKTAHGAHAPDRCGNCSTQLAGPYCHHCGQMGHVHRSLLHLLEELVHGILHFDTKSWRTLPLLVARPGLLTRRYIDGQRTRYVSPLALFLFSVFLMFFVFSTVANTNANSPVKVVSELEESRAELSKEIEQGRERVAEAEAKVAQARTAEDREDAAGDLADARSELHVSEGVLASLNVTSPKVAAADRSQTTQVVWPATLGEIGKELSQNHPALARIVRHAAENPALTLYKLKNSAYKFAFMLVPISLPFLWLMFFWRKGVTMYDHTVFTLYGLSFLSLWWALIAVITSIPLTKGLTGAAVLFQPVHLFMQLKETYVLGWGATLWRTIAVLVAGCIVVGLFSLLVLFISLH
jgi:hypothetical protein